MLLIQIRTFLLTLIYQTPDKNMNNTLSWLLIIWMIPNNNLDFGYEMQFFIEKQVIQIKLLLK